MTDFYPPGWADAYKKEEKIDTIQEHVQDFEVTEQEDEFFEQLTRLAGVSE